MDKLTYILLTETELRNFAREVASSVAREIIDALGAPPETLSVKQAAQALHVSQTTIANWVARGVITGHRLGGRLIINAADIKALLTKPQ